MAQLVCTCIRQLLHTGATVGHAPFHHVAGDGCGNLQTARHDRHRPLLPEVGVSRGGVNSEGQLIIIDLFHDPAAGTG
jgi:hypothetical protein